MDNCGSSSSLDQSNGVGHSQTASIIVLDNFEDCKKDEKYNPFHHRNVAHPTSTIGSFFHLLKSSLGTGLLAMPVAFKHSGVVPGCIGIVLVAVIATHCIHILVQTSRDLCEKCRVGSLSYTDTCVEAFKCGPSRLRKYTKQVRIFVDSSMAGVCLGGTSVYVIFIATTVKDICDYLAPEQVLNVKVYCAILLLPLILITQLRYLKFLVPFSIFANFCMVLTFGVTCYYIFDDFPTLAEVVLVNNAKEWPLFITTAIFAIEGINIVMPIENEMAKPKYFLGCLGILNVTMCLVAILYGFVGLIGYLKYGDQVLGSVTLNLPQTDVLAMSTKVLVALGMFFTYCLQMYAPMDILWIRIRKFIDLRYHNVSQVALRTFAVSLTVILAIVVPDLELLIGVVGAIFFSTLGILIPIVVETVHRWNGNLGIMNYVLYKNFLLAIFYLIVLLSGCYSSIKEIIVRYSN